MNKKITNFISGQISQIRKGDLSVLFRKLFAILLILLAVPVIILIRLLRPLILIRSGKIISSRIGLFAASTELYLCRRDLSKSKKRIFDIFYHQKPICNRQLKKMWERVLFISPFVYWLDKVNWLIPGGDKHALSTLSADRDIDALLERTQPHLSFMPEEERLGEAALRKLGISNGAPFVCFHSRTSVYLEKVFPNWDWHYHNYRNSSIKNFIPAAEELARRGYFLLRMGAIIKKPLETTNPMIIDYVAQSRTEFLDIFLGAKCHFYLGDSCGFHAIPMIFRRPLAIVNMISLEYAPTWGSNYLFIPKKLWLRNERRFMRFREILDLGVGRFVRTEQYEQLDIEVIENTPEEIADVAVEIHERLKGNWQTSEEDEQLQRQFWALFKPSELNQVFLSHIGAKFLRQNRELLE